MTIKNKVRILLVSCVGMVTFLCGIQYSLVRNTYALNRKSYFDEVTRTVNTIGQSFMDSANHRAIKAITQHIAWYINTKDRNGLLDSVSRVVLLANHNDQQRLTTLLDSAFGDPPTKFAMQYSSIVLTVDGNKDTLLNSTQPAFVILGARVSEDQLHVGDGIQTNGFTGKDLGIPAQHMMFTLTVTYSKKVDVSGWQQQVVQRMVGTFLLAGLLILGTVVLFYIMFRTMLHQKKLADIQTDLTHNITHELKTPLSSLAIISKSLRKISVREQPVLYEDLTSSLDRQLQKLSYIVDRVLESAWVTESPVHLKPHEMNALLRQIVGDFPMETHTLMLDIPHGQVLIQTDEYVLTGIIHNILDNAVKYSNAGTQVELTAYTEKDQYVIAIKDQGKGIKNSEQPKIFAKFYRVTEKDLHTVKGIGLGLYLCQVNTKRISGLLSVKSEPLKGSTFTIRLPLK